MVDLKRYSRIGRVFISVRILLFAAFDATEVKSAIHMLEETMFTLTWEDDEQWYAYIT